MKIEKQVCSLKLAKKLKELGVKQDSLWFWYIPSVDGNDKDLVLDSKGRVLSRDGNFAEVHERIAGFEIIEKFSAFTVAELGEILPEEVKTEELDFHFRTKKKKDNHWIVKYVGRKGSGTSFRYNSLKKNSEGEKGKTESDARAKCLCYLIENNLIKNK